MRNVFKSVDLPYVIQFLTMFHNDHPTDVIVDSLLVTLTTRSTLVAVFKTQTLGISCVENLKNMFCMLSFQKLKFIDGKRISHIPSLFQHIGTISSLKGKTQKLQVC